MPRPFRRLAGPVLGAFALLPFAALAEAPAAAEVCPISGDRIAWTTDYCLALLETDDESLAGPCLDQELQRRFLNACEGVTYYKQGMCGLAAHRGSYPGSAEQCLADAGFQGAHVRRRAAVRADEAASGTPPP